MTFTQPCRETCVNTQHIFILLPSPYLKLLQDLSLCFWYTAQFKYIIHTAKSKMDYDLRILKNNFAPTYINLTRINIALRKVFLPEAPAIINSNQNYFTPTILTPLFPNNNLQEKGLNLIFLNFLVLISALK